MARRPIYLDYAATSPADPRVIDAMTACLGVAGAFANPSSDHAMGRAAAAIVDDARRRIAARVGAVPDRLVFTSGATEANNLAIRGALAASPPQRRHVVTTRIEHKSVLDVVAALEARGVEATYVDCDPDGLVAAEAIADAVRADTALVSVMHVNNETGAVQPIEEIVQLCRARGVRVHVDAAQSVGKLPLALDALGVDLCSLTAHKLCGPKGVGALYVRAGVVLEPLLFGGEQQGALRPGTLPVHQIVGMGEAYALADPAVEGPRTDALRKALWSALEPIPGVRLNGRLERTAPHILNVTFPGVDGEALRHALREIALSSGSACTSASPEASHVLSTMGLADAAAIASIRFGLGRFTAPDEIVTVARRVEEEVARLRRLAEGAPAWCSATRASRAGGAAVL